MPRLLMKQILVRPPQRGKSRHTNRPYLEAHHLIPMSLQKDTQKKLDVLDNIFSLCPYCHRAIHHADKNLTINIIDKLVDKRPKVLDIINLQRPDMYSFYAVRQFAKKHTNQADQESAVF